MSSPLLRLRFRPGTEMRLEQIAQPLPSRGFVSPSALMTRRLESAQQLRVKRFQTVPVGSFVRIAEDRFAAKNALAAASRRESKQALV